MWTPISIIGWLFFFLTAVLLLPSSIILLTRRLENWVDQIPQPAKWPRVTVIVPARDEGQKVEAGLRSILASDYPALEVIAVNDRSTDTTGEIMDRLTAGDERARVIHITELPENWLGKSHAMHVATQAAQGEIFLFTDGDVIFQSDAIRLTVAYALAHGLDHLCLFPRMIPGGYCENALITFFGLAMAAGTQAWLVRTSFPYAYVGVGAFNMVRREAYEQVGGFQTIRLDVLDDIKLGKLLKRAGFRPDILLARNLIRIKWQDSAWGIVRGFEKNGFAATDYSVFKALLVTLLTSLLLFTPYAAVLIFGDLRCLGFAATGLMLHLLYTLFGWNFDAGWKIIPALPLAGLAIIFALWRSVYLTLKQQGVRWRETFYPLGLLRENRYD